MASRKAREKLQPAHCRQFRAKNRVENIVLGFAPEKLHIGMSSLRGTHFSSVFFIFPRGKERSFETKHMYILGFVV